MNATEDAEQTIAIRDAVQLAATGAEPDFAVWEQWDNEPTLWYQRFHAYLLLGGRRSVARIYRVETDSPRYKFPPRAWYDKADEWQWEKRAEAWDAKTLRDERQAAIDEKLEARNKRRQILMNAADVLADKIEDLNHEDINWRDAPNAIKTITEGLREEYDDLPTQRTESTVTFKLVQELTVYYIRAVDEIIGDLPDAGERRVRFATRVKELTEGAVVNDA